MLCRTLLEPPHSVGRYSYDSISWSGALWYRLEPGRVAGHYQHRVRGLLRRPGGGQCSPERGTLDLCLGITGQPESPLYRFILKDIV